MKYLAIVILSVIALSSIVSTASAQGITLTKADYINFETNQNNGVTDSAINPSALTPIIAQSGANQTWDFTAATYKTETQTGTGTVLPFSTTSGIPDASDPDFAAANNVLEYNPNDGSPITYLFLETNNSGVWDLGSSEDSAGTPVKLEGLNPGSEDLAFPLMYGTTWQTTSNIDGEEVPPTVSATITEMGVVDGYGTLVTANHSDAALRVKQTTITAFSSHGFTEADTSVTYSFYTQDGYSADIDLSTLGTVNFADYTTPSGSTNSAVNSTQSMAGLSLTISQNPASAGTNIAFTLPNAASVQIELMDALGRSVRMLESGFEAAGQHSLPIGATSLASGTYFVRLQAGDESTMQKLVLQ